MPPAIIDEAITDVLGSTAGALGLDVAMLCQPCPDGSDECLAATHHWLKDVRQSIPDPAAVVAIRAVSQKLDSRDSVWFARPDEIRDTMDRERLTKQGIRAVAIIPLVIDLAGRSQLGALTFGSLTREHEWSRHTIDDLQLLAAIVAQALSRKSHALALEHATRQLELLQARPTSALPRQAVNLGPRRVASVVTDSRAVRRALAQVESVAQTPSTVLLLGETGAGKEVFAQAIHDLSTRRHRPMVRINCAAIPSTLLESELFGRERGAYTGAVTRQIGRFEAADHSTLFLDEVGELSLEMQVKLLRVLQERVIERLGGNGSIKVDVRIVAATNRDLEKAIAAKTFREDLYYRLNVFPIVVPPLRERIEDIPGLVWKFVDELAGPMGKSIRGISTESMRQLQEYSWPGNVRQLRNVIERAIIISDGPILDVLMPEPDAAAPGAPVQTLQGVETAHIYSTLELTRWRVRGKGGAAERLGLKPTTLETRMAKLGITRPKD
jgi:transcriptional regulator with GAF, ATPase, and Fis domain